MLSMIEVKCPHCGSQGQIMLPPLGSIIVGPCPQCQGMLCIFSGRILPLDNEIMTQGGSEERQDHLYQVLGNFLRERIEKLFETAPEFKLDNEELADELTQNNFTEIKESSINPFGNVQEAPITVEEIHSFRNVELKLIDNSEYFKAVFRN